MTLAYLTAQYASLLSAAEERDGVWVLTAEPRTLRALLEALRPTFTYPEDLSCTDEGDTLRVWYRLYSMADRQAVQVRVRLPRTGGQLPTASDLWRGYDWQEREAYDMFGVVFNGHPDLRRILTWDGFPGHPLLKDFVVDNDDSSWQIPEQTDKEILTLLEQD